MDNRWLMNSNDHEEPWDWPKILARVALIALALGALYLLLKALRRGGGPAFFTAALPFAAMGITATQLRKHEPIDQEQLRNELKEVAQKAPIVTPTELYEALREQGLPFSSVRQMARELTPLGLRSEVRTVPARSERRWYDLSGYGTHETSA